MGVAHRALIAASYTLVIVLCNPTASLAHDHKVDDSCGTAQTTYFYAAGPSSGWYTHAAGINSCHMWTPSTHSTTGIVNWANWYLPTTSNYNHDYYVWTYLVNDSHFTGNPVTYRRYRSGTAAGVTETYKVNQSAERGAWFLVTKVNGPPDYDHFYGTKGGYMRVVDLTGSTLQAVGVDQMQYTTR